jgi:hypothetical protein
VSDSDAAPGSSRPPSRAGRAFWALASLVCVGFTVYVLWQFASTTWDAAVLTHRGEVVAATVVEVDLNSRTGMPDELVVASPPPHEGVAIIDTRREDLGVGAVVDVVVDPRDTSRAALAEDGWPWLDLAILLMGVVTGPIFALVALGAALGLTSDDEAGADADGDTPAPTAAAPGAPGAHDGSGSDERA